jgi:murein DD-endopeptidase MepM/ murein hydrolase activator NlpD
MTKVCWAAVAALCCIASPGWGSTAEQARAEEERFLGSANERAQHASYLPFTRRLNVTGIVTGSLEDSAKAAGLPAVAALEFIRAFAGAIDLNDDLLNGDSFSVSYRQEYTVEGHLIGVPVVMWAELRTAVRGNFSVHRFRPGRGKQERLWLANGQATGSTALRWPVDEINISSGFGLRTNPMIKQVRRKNGTGGPTRGGTRRYGLLMHHGVDFAAETGTPVHAAAAGMVTGARPNGGYGNWIEIRHEGEFETVYGHLSAFAPGIVEDVWVERGQLIGFVGSTGRSTGPHLHFELQRNGVPTDPIVHPTLKRPQMRGGELARFRRTIARNLEEAQRECAPTCGSYASVKSHHSAFGDERKADGTLNTELEPDALSAKGIVGRVLGRRKAR